MGHVRKIPTKNEKLITTKNNRAAITGSCNICGSKNICSFVDKYNI